MKSLLKILAGMVLTVLVTVLLVARIVLDIIGYTTAPDDFELLQQRMPSILEWLFSTPWWVSALFQLAIVMPAAWLLISGTRRATADEIEEHPGFDREAIMAMIESKIPNFAEAISSEQLANLVDARLEEFSSTKLAAQFKTHAQAHGRDTRLADLAEKVKLARDLSQSTQSFAEKRFGDVGIDIRSLEEQAAQLRRDFEAWVQQHNKSQDQRFKNLDGGFRALRDREVLIETARSMTEMSDWLLRTSRGEKVDDWDVWSSLHFDWNMDLERYCKIAARYIPDAPSLIRDVQAHHVSGRWPEDSKLFPNDHNMIAHRTLCVMKRNFEVQHQRVLACVESFAFQAPSMKGIPDG